MRTKRKSVLEDYYRIQYVGTPDYCDVKQLLAYTLSRAIEGSDRYKQQIVVKNVSTGEEQIVTAGGDAERNPRFSSDGTKLLFISNATGDDQLYVRDFVRGTTMQLTTMRYGLSDPVWSPSGDQIAFLSACPIGEDEDQLQIPFTAEQKRKRREQLRKRPVVIEDYGYKSEAKMGFADRESTHLWIVDVDGRVADVRGGNAKRLTDGQRDHVMPVWSPDGSYLIFTSNRAQSSKDFIGYDLFKVVPETGEMTQITKDMWIAYYPAAFVPRFTPDGKYVIVGALKPSLEGGMPPTSLFRITPDGEESECIFPDDAPCHEATCFFYNSENYGGIYETAQVSSDGKYVYFISGWHGAADIYRAAIEGTPEIVKMTNGRHHYKQLGLPQNGRMIALKGHFHQTPQVVLIDDETWKETPLTNSNPWFAELDFSEPEEVWIDTLDGESRVQGWVFPPQQAAPGEKYPAIVYIHGGPTPFYGYGLNYEHQAIAGAGFGLIICNFRGSSGYGRKHMDMKKAYDGTAMYDILQFTDEAVRRFPWIDGERLGVTGGSFGGYMTNWIAAHTSRFKAAVTQRSIANKMIQYASSDMAGSSKAFESFQDFMIDQIKSSPVAYADKINIPFLILHGMQDMRCPVEHAHQLFTAIKDTHPDLPVRMVLYPGANHGLTMGGPMRLRLSHYRELIDWFRTYL